MISAETITAVLQWMEETLTNRGLEALLRMKVEKEHKAEALTLAFAHIRELLSNESMSDEAKVLDACPALLAIYEAVPTVRLYFPQETYWLSLDTIIEGTQLFMGKAIPKAGDQ